MVAHHTAGGCNLRPGDLLGSGTVSGPGEGQRGCLLVRVAFVLFAPMGVPNRGGGGAWLACLAAVTDQDGLPSQPAGCAVATACTPQPPWPRSDAPAHLTGPHTRRQEITWNGTKPLHLGTPAAASGEAAATQAESATEVHSGAGASGSDDSEGRSWLLDGDEVVMRGWCGGGGTGQPRIGFGECRGRLLPARGAA